MRKIKIFVLTFILLFSLIGIARAEEYNIQIKIEKDSTLMEMSLNGIVDPKEDDDYYIKFVKDNTSKPQFIGHPQDTQEKIGSSVYEYNKVYITYDETVKTYSNTINVDDDWYMLDGYTTAYLIDCNNYDSSKESNDTNTCEILENPITVEKPELPKLTQRYQNFLFTENETFKENTLSVFQEFPYRGETGSHEINVKVGLISDNELLRKIARSEAGCMDELLAYAKKTNGSIFTSKDTDFYDIPIGNFDVVNDAYYYMYTYYTNTDGVYRNLDDVTVVMGEADMLVNDVDWGEFNAPSLWEKYVDKYKNTESIKKYNENNISVDIKSNESTLNSIIDDGTIKLVSNFNYKDGVVSYVPLDDKEVSFETIFNEDTMIENAIVALANLKGYNSEKLKTWLYENEGKLSLEKDGIEYTLEDYTKNQDNGVTLTVKKVKSFKFKLDSEIKLDTNKLENPKTGLDLNYNVLLGIILIGGIIYTFVRKQSKFPKHN